MWDLFNPIPNFNYKIMIKDINIDLLENPYVQVVWEDYAENFTQEKIKSVRHYFQKKYLTNNVNVITKTKVSDNIDDENVDISFNILDDNYQTKLITDFVKSKYDVNLIDDILKLNSTVDEKLIINNNDTTPFKKWYIKSIKFSNFLSYGDNQKLDFEKYNGISVVESNPPNFGGKSVLTIDLLLFLFFNETTKTTKSEEIFNRFTNKDRVNVEGNILIDGEEYVIVRNIIRKKSKSGDWNIKTELDFFKKLSDGTLLNFTGEQRQETEKFIKNSIGTKDDFLMTILTTSTNLEELIDSKPTARGQVLSKFMGLDFLKRKEESAKEIYSQFSKSMLSNVYNSESLKTENQNYETKINDNEIEIEKTNKDLEVTINNIKIGQDYRDNLLKNKHIIDNEISLISPNKVQEEINSLEFDRTKVENQLREVNVNEPTEYYHEDLHDKIKEEIFETQKDLIRFDTQISEIERLKSSVEGGIKCEHCGIELMNAAITNAKIGELNVLIVHKTQKNLLMHELNTKEQSFVSIKKEFDEYEKNKLIKEKYQVSIESINLKIDALKLKLNRYNEVQNKVIENKKTDELIIRAGMRLDELDREKSLKQRTIDNLRYQINTMVTKIAENKKIIQKIDEESEKEKIYKIYLDIFGKNGISKIIMKTMIPLINSELQRLLEGSCHFRVEVRINDKNEVEFIMVDNNTQIEKLMSSGSGYERTIASLALRAVLSKICSLPKPNIVVFDEVFGKISNDNLDMVSEFFIKIKEYFEKIFVITHNPLVSNWADNVIKIKKEENISFIS
jgi:DNA repair exonuclease SbcCD ATPase subunit